MNISPQGLAEIVLPTMQVVKDQQKEIERLEADVTHWKKRYEAESALRPHWAQGFTDDSVAAQLLTTKVERLEAENAALSAWMERAFVVHPNIDVDIAAIKGEKL